LTSFCSHFQTSAGH